MLVAIFLTLIAWFAAIPLPLKIVTTVVMSIKFIVDLILFLYRMAKASEKQ